jgi:glycerate-2-kinase
VLLWASGSDGIDGITDSAGAWVDGLTMEKARKMGIVPHLCLADNNSYFFFEQVNGLIKTGPTGTNVMDLIFLIRGEK